MKYTGWTILIGTIIGFILGYVATYSALGATMRTRCVVGNKDCFVIRVGTAELSAVDRMSLINERLAKVLGVAKPGDIHVETTETGESAVYCGRTCVVTCTAADVRANGSDSPRTLANVWATNLAAALR